MRCQYCGYPKVSVIKVWADKGGGLPTAVLAVLPAGANLTSEGAKIQPGALLRDSVSMQQGKEDFI